MHNIQLQSEQRQKLQERCKPKEWHTTKRSCHCGGSIGWWSEEYVKDINTRPDIIGSPPYRMRIETCLSPMHCYKCKILYAE